MVKTWSNSRVPGLLIDLRRDGGVALHRQIETAIRDAIQAGRLRIGASLPPTRALAGDLGVSRGVVVEACQQLVAEGYLTSRPGGYTEVAIDREPAAPTAAPAPAPPPMIDFGYGRSNVSHFPRAVWMRSTRRVLTNAPNERFLYLSGRGMHELREALADYLMSVSCPRGSLTLLRSSRYGPAYRPAAKTGQRRRLLGGRQRGGGTRREGGPIAGG